jgi:small-conductance mechanosensitive channel/CRP-like cAMP-binding protein
MMIQMQELLVGVVGLAVTLAVRVITVNRLIRSKLRLAALSFAAYLVVGGLLRLGLLAQGSAPQFLSIAHLLLALGIVTLVVVSAVNPWRVDRTPEHFPNIVQDTIIIGVFLVIGTSVMQEKFLTTSAVGAVVIGFALQDTLGNTFAGLAIQVEKPFRVDQWVRIGSLEGRVAAITWRATRLVTKNGDAVFVPNNVVSKEAITNFSEPAGTTRLFVDVGASYLVPPNEVKAVVRDAIRDAPLVLQDPAPEIVVAEFAASSITYRIKFWVADYGVDDPARDQVRTCVYYAFRRNGIEIPYPIQVHHRRADVAPGLTSAADRQAFIDAVDLFQPLLAEDRARLAAAARERLYGAGQTVVRQNDIGDSMFVIGRGRVRVSILPADTEVAILPSGGYFGEMSLLTGQPRTANVAAIEECLLLEIATADFRQIALAQPAVLEQVTAAVVQRQAGLDRSREAMAVAAPAAELPRSFLLRVREFLKL